MQFAHHQLFDPRFPPGGTLPLTGWTDEGQLIQGKSWTRVEIQGKELGSFPLTRVGRSVGHIVVVGFGAARLLKGKITHPPQWHRGQ